MFTSIGIEKEAACCFTGHRHLSREEAARVRPLLRREVAHLATDKGVEHFLTGGALGFDTLAAQETLYAKEELPWIRLTLVLPCRGQEARWAPKDRAVYQTLQRQADEVLFLADAYSNGCMHARNRFLVDHSAYCLCYLRDTARGGTAYTVRYAKKRGSEVANLFEPDWDAYGDWAP